jgi:hypothetical protein
MFVIVRHQTNLGNVPNTSAYNNKPKLRFLLVSIISESVIHNGCFFKFGVEVGIELSIVNALHRLRITDRLFKSYVFTRVVRSQSTLQRLLRRQI